jgi:hypothetical protein
MPKAIFAVLPFLFFLPIIRAQAPVDQDASKVPENLITFNSWDAEIRKVNGHWELWSGAVKIKELGNREIDAREVLRLVRLLNLNQVGTVGKPRPVMEYWLSEGRAPQKMGRLNALALDPEALKVANSQGQWCLVDDSRLWFTFGAQADEARRALELLRKYQFTDVLYVGVGNPVMIVFLAGSEKSPKMRAPVSGGAKGRGSEDAKGSRPPSQTEPAQWFQPPQLHVNSTLAEPVTGNPMVHFDWRQAAVRCEKLDWQVVVDGQVLAHFGNREMEARQALRAMQTLHLTECCQVGEPTPLLTFFLSNGEPAHGLFFGGANQLCHAKELSLKRVGLRWAIWECDRPLLTLGTNEQEAQQVLQVLQHYKVDHICQIGTSDPPPMTIFVRTQ